MKHFVQKGVESHEKCRGTIQFIRKLRHAISKRSHRLSSCAANHVFLRIFDDSLEEISADSKLNKFDRCAVNVILKFNLGFFIELISLTYSIISVSPPPPPSFNWSALTVHLSLSCFSSSERVFLNNLWGLGTE